MKVLLIILDVSIFLFFRFLKTGTIVAAIIYFATVADKKTTSGLVDLNQYTKQLTGMTFEKKVK